MITAERKRQGDMEEVKDEGEAEGEERKTKRRGREEMRRGR